jgi:hypothetical protein
MIIEKIKSGKSEEREEFMRAIRVGIEFSMAIGAVEFLMTELFEEFSNRNLDGLFLENLLPFILSEKLKRYSIQEDILRKIIYYYRDKEDYDTLEKVILCLNFDDEELIFEI